MKVVITGASGSIGKVVCPGLHERGVEVVGTDVVDLPSGIAGVGGLDLNAPDALSALTELLADVDGLVHLAGIPGEEAWPTIRAANADTTQIALQSCADAGVNRVVLASSNHATGFTPRPADGMLPSDAPHRPDSFYGVTKATMEALGALYVERHAMDVVSLRIGSFRPKPARRRELATWLSEADGVRLVYAALTAPSPGHAVVWGISDNTRAWWDLATARALGYEPVDDAEAYADEIIAEQGEPDWFGDDELRLVGGPFARRDRSR